MRSKKVLIAVVGVLAIVVLGGAVWLQQPSRRAQQLPAPTQTSPVRRTQDQPVVAQNPAPQKQTSTSTPVTTPTCVAGLTADQCANSLAQATSDETYCAKIKDQTLKDGCYESLADGSDNPKQMCSKVVSPKDFCQLYAPATWASFHSSTFGLSLQFPPGLFDTSNLDGSSTSSSNAATAGYDLSGIKLELAPFSTTFSVAMDSYQLRYDQSTNMWSRQSWNDTQFMPICQSVTLLGTQKIPAYRVGNSHEEEYVVILKQGLLHITQVPTDGPPSPDDYKTFDTVMSTLTLDHPESVIAAKCN